MEYDNGILLDKAKDKLLFLSFCIEFKRFYNFQTNENLMEFETYLPIQLDATCNGFQHLALLSNEKVLFKELNLTSHNDKPKDFYNFLLHKLKLIFEHKVSLNELIDDKTSGSYDRLNNFIWDRAFVKKAIMTIPYNVSVRQMQKYISECLTPIESLKDGKIIWYSTSDKDKNLINTKDISLLIHCLNKIINEDFEKIKKLSKYLKNIATLFITLNLPITWTLPTGLTIKQSYLETISTSITPFMYSKIKINLKVTVKGTFSKNKQITALMPNLIHSLDASSLSLFFNKFNDMYNSDSLKNNSVQFYSVHDCFGTTCDKVSNLKILLASVYTELYSTDPYLYRFDNQIMDFLENSTDYVLDRDNRTLVLNKDNKSFKLHDIDWVTNKKLLSQKTINEIDNQEIDSIEICSDNILI